MGDDELVTEVYKEIEEKEIEIDNEGYCKSLAAFSFYRLGDEEKAEELREDAADDEFEIAEENLEELELPAHERDVFALPMNYWLPSAYLSKLLGRKNKRGKSKNYGDKIKTTDNCRMETALRTRGKIK